MPPAPNFLRFDEGMEFLRSIENDVTRRLLYRAMFFAVKDAGTEERSPHSPFDIRFFLGVLAQFLSEQEQDHVRRILNGEDLGVDDVSEGPVAKA